MLVQVLGPNGALKLQVPDLTITSYSVVANVVFICIFIVLDTKFVRLRIIHSYLQPVSFRLPLEPKTVWGSAFTEEMHS